MNEFRETITKLERINLREGKGHLDHPEDLVFLDGEAGASRAVQAIENTINNPSDISTKFDGYPALVFGMGIDNKFSIMDKHMFNKKDGSGRQIYSPEDFINYDRRRGVDRGSLHHIIERIWSGLEKSDRGSNGYYWGDLLFGQPIQAEEGMYKFQPNPNGILYVVNAKSELGKLLSDKQAAIAVHQFIPAAGASTENAISLNGTIGNLENNSDVAIVPSKLPITPKLKLNKSLKKIANQQIKQYGRLIDDLMNSAPQSRNTFNQLFTTYINKKIVSGNLTHLLRDFTEYVQNRPMSDGMQVKILEYLNSNKAALTGIFKVWIALYNLKMDVVQQLNQAVKSSPIIGYLKDGTECHEGFVSQGVKFVDRMGFSRQNLQTR